LIIKYVYYTTKLKKCINLCTYFSFKKKFTINKKIMKRCSHKREKDKESVNRKTL